MKKTAIILGATGLTGGLLLDQLINDNNYQNIKLFSRSKIEDLPSKVTQFIGDVLQLEQFKTDFTADQVFCCIGTTKAKTPDKELYKQIDYGIPVTAAKLAKANGIDTFLVISALGANAKSKVFYNKTKGEMERDVLKQHIKNTFIFQPSLIGGNRKENRILEAIGLAIFKVIQPLFFGKLKEYKITDPLKMVKAMINLANRKNYAEVIITSNEIKRITKNN
ncbi:nucleoside-diphosphate sugar epimerase [Tenacibaculum todarodis]|uniref:Nucleoside-diphosphate sugar epimerase n=1 Tax=Tenacibaculum todarodis TaxID=1850252 RepID=A0A1L3JH75_9FLAO|nr:NAD(P)H-binding protein [Tenacibaculum todarodis]APG64490.1 nucleoside-diphosphate sugar epimerase [Tenacibaculum todarodis]